MKSLQLILCVLILLCKLVASSDCPPGSICATDGICADSRQFGQPCGDNLICCAKIINTSAYLKSHARTHSRSEDSSTSRYANNQVDDSRNYQSSADILSSGQQENRYSRPRNVLSDEALRLLRAYTYNGECGVRRLQHGKISTGHTVDSGITSYAEFPWHVAILLRMNRIRNTDGYNDAYKYHCGGVLIDQGVVLTAAHCVQGVRLESLKLRLGEYNLQGTRGEIFPVIERRVRRKIIHDNYNPSKYIHDIAILILDRVVDLTKTPHISPACMPPKDLKFEKYTKCFVTGYGEDVFKPNYGSNILKSASVTLHEENRCKDLLYQSIKKLSSGFFHSSQSCITGSSGRDACTGDGGGAVVCPILNSKVSVCNGGYGCQPEHYFLAGIISWGSEDCGREDSVTVISDMVSHRDWLFSELSRARREDHPYHSPNQEQSRGQREDSYGNEGGFEESHGYYTENIRRNDD